MRRARACSAEALKCCCDPVNTIAGLDPLAIILVLISWSHGRSGPWSLVLGPHFLSMVFGPWPLIPGPLFLVPGPQSWSLPPVPWSMVLGPWSMVQVHMLHFSLFSLMPHCFPLSFFHLFLGPLHYFTFSQRFRLHRGCVSIL